MSNFSSTKCLVKCVRTQNGCIFNLRLKMILSWREDIDLYSYLVALFVIYVFICTPEKESVLVKGIVWKFNAAKIVQRQSIYYVMFPIILVIRTLLIMCVCFCLWRYALNFMKGTECNLKKYFYKSQNTCVYSHRVNS